MLAKIDKKKWRYRRNRALAFWILCFHTSLFSVLNPSFCSLSVYVLTSRTAYNHLLIGLPTDLFLAVFPSFFLILWFAILHTFPVHIILLNFITINMLYQVFVYAVYFFTVGLYDSPNIDTSPAAHFIC